MEISNILKTMSQITQYVPFVSVPMSLVNIFVKAVILPRADSRKNEYLKFVAKKSWGETLATPIPFIGGVVCCIERMRKDASTSPSVHPEPNRTRPRVDLIVKPMPLHVISGT